MLGKRRARHQVFKLAGTQLDGYTHRADAAN